MSLKLFLLCQLNISIICFVTAQKDTIYLDSKGANVAPSLAKTYQVRTMIKKSQTEIIEEYDATLGYKSRQYVLKKSPPWTLPEVIVTVSLISPFGQRMPSITKDKLIKTLDSSMVKHGGFMEWYPSGQLKTRGTYMYGRLHGILESFYPSDKPMQIEEYHLDTLNSSSFFDSLGTQITHAPYFELPKYPEGEKAMFRFLATTIRYPSKARDIGFQEAIYVSFSINKEGKTTNIKTLKSNSKDLADEAIKVIKAMPKWKPARMNGEPIEMTLLLPIIFRIE
jgi:TonB family protein